MMNLLWPETKPAGIPPSSEHVPLRCGSFSCLTNSDNSSNSSVCQPWRPVEPLLSLPHLWSALSPMRSCCACSRTAPLLGDAVKRPAVAVGEGLEQQIPGARREFPRFRSDHTAAVEVDTLRPAAARRIRQRAHRLHAAAAATAAAALPNEKIS